MPTSVSLNVEGTALARNRQANRVRFIDDNNKNHRDSDYDYEIFM